MTITRDYALRLIRRGDADKAGSCCDAGQRYIVLARYDLQRTDHYLAIDGEEG
jgi:hypothetical protein